MKIQGCEGKHKFESVFEPFCSNECSRVSVLHLTGRISEHPLMGGALLDH